LIQNQRKDGANNIRQTQIALGITLLTLAVFSVVPGIRATEASEVNTNSKTTPDPFAPDSRVSLSLPLQGSEDLTYGAVTESLSGEPSASELNRQLTNPVSSIWSIANQFNNFELNNGHWNNNWNFQPVMPVSLTKGWNLITRPVMPFYNIVPHETAPGNFERATGLGDLALVELLSPAHSGNWILGAGPTFIFPTATSPFTGQRKWQMGPTAVVGYLTKEFFIGVFPQQWWSIGGEHGRPDTNQMNLQPIATIFFGEGWSLGYSGNILADWNAPSEDVWTVPVGLGLAKVVKLGRLPVKVQLAVQYIPVASPDLRTGVERAGADHSCHAEAHQGRPVPVTRKDDTRAVSCLACSPSLSAHKLRSAPVEKTCLIE